MGYGAKIIVSGDYALFSRPEMKVERVSYDVPTPSALVGLISSVYWHPGVKYIIDKIVVYNPISFVNIRRNEVKEKLLPSDVFRQMQGKKADTVCHFFPDTINVQKSLFGPFILLNTCNFFQRNFTGTYILRRLKNIFSPVSVFAFLQFFLCSLCQYLRRRKSIIFSAARCIQMCSVSLTDIFNTSAYPPDIILLRNQK